MLNWIDLLPVGEEMDQFEREAMQLHPPRQEDDMDVQTSYSAMMDQHGFVPMNHQAPQFFPVSTEHVYDGLGKVVPNYKRIVRGDTGDTLHVATDSYTLVPYEEHFSIFEEAIQQSGLPLEGMRIGTDMADNGARIFRQYLLPAVQEEVQGQKITLRIVMFDSYNGTTAFTGRSGFFNFACANQSFFGKSLLDVKFKHTGDMQGRVKKAAEELTMSAVRFEEEAKRLQNWPKVILTPVGATALLQALPQINRGLTDSLTAQYSRESGRTLWDFYNVLTSWATHGVNAKTANDRSKRVLDLVEGRDWQDMERPF